jgi:hypothetical protein
MIACQATLATDRSGLNVLQDYHKVPPEREASRPPRAPEHLRAASCVSPVPACAGTTGRLDEIHLDFLVV